MELTPFQTFIVAIVLRISIPIILLVGVLYFYKNKTKKGK